jgi:cellulose synthase/poly-beta-1,6-N-acetylglucosamine synthase-like glycosyltransferase
MKDFEVIVADDGSGPEIRAVVERARRADDLAVTHLWQEDAGFRKNAILNKAIEASQTEYLTFIDGDCLPHRHFLADHASRRAENSVLCGRRVNLGPQMTERLTTGTVAKGAHEKVTLALLIDGARSRSTNLEDAIRIGSDAIRTRVPRNRARILGCNFSVHKALLEKINGFDEDYQAPGLGEDTDIAFRLELLGAQFVSLRYLAVLYHLYHPQTIIGDVNRRLFENVVQQRRAVCPNGLRKLAS